MAVIDTGVEYTNFELAWDIAPGGISIIDGVHIPDGGSDPNGAGHGTLVSLIITDTSGVAPDAKILPIRVPAEGARPWDDLIDAINYVTERRRADPTIRVINLSWGGGLYDCLCETDTDINQRLSYAIDEALSAGIVTFACTGSDAFCGGVVSPACPMPLRSSRPTIRNKA